MKISDYKIPHYFLKSFTKSHEIPFVDLDIGFYPGITPENMGISGGELRLGGYDSLLKTYYAIVGTYIKNIQHVSGVEFNPEDVNQILTFYLSVIRLLGIGNQFDTDYSQPIEGEINKFPIVYIILKEIIYPAYGRTFDPIKVLAGTSPFIDAAKLITEHDVNTIGDFKEYPFVFVNMDVKNEVYRNAFLLSEALNYKFDSANVVRDIFNNPELLNPIKSLLEISLNSDLEVKAFLGTLKALNEFKDASIKTASSDSSVWEQISLIEKTLEPARGADWSTYETLKDYNKDLWDRIEEERKRRDLPQLPFEAMLRIQAEDYKNDTSQVIQHMLSDVRIW